MSEKNKEVSVQRKEDSLSDKEKSSGDAKAEIHAERSASEMADSSRDIYRNPPPPTDDFQFETCIVTRVREKFIFMDQIDEEIFNTPWSGEDEPLTSSEDDAE